MKESIIRIWMMIRLAIGMACKLLAAVISIPTELLYVMVLWLDKVGDKLIAKTHVDGKQIVEEIVDM